MTRMAWTAEDRRKYAPAIQEVLRQGMIVQLVRTMDALDPQPKVGRERVWSTLIMLQALWHLVRDGCAWRRLPAGFPPLTTVWSRLRRWRELAGGARPRPGDPRRLPPARARPQAAADGGDHRHPELEDRAAARAAGVRRRQEGQGPQARAAGRHRGRSARHPGRPGRRARAPGATRPGARPRRPPHAAAGLARPRLRRGGA